MAGERPFGGHCAMESLDAPMFVKNALMSRGE
jgi:hypothetical protein